MPPKKRKGKKGKGKRKKGGKKGPKKAPEPPPLHTLTDLYNLLLEKIGHLNQMRIQSRKKRLEAWFMTREMFDAKSDGQIYHDHLDDQVNELHELIEKIMDELEKERAAIQREINRLMAELNKKHEQILKRTLEVEQELSRIKAELVQFEPLMAKLAKMLLRLEQLAQEIAAAELEADIKTRHLKNQFLCERGKLHNHLETQLYDLIQNCRSYIMPILWHHMKRMGFTNQCTRWRLAKADAKNIRLGERREELMLKRKLLTIEKSYMGVDWAFFKLSEIQAKRKESLRVSRKLTKVETDEPVAELASAFNIYLRKRLTAFQEAKRRDQRNKKLKASESSDALMNADDRHVRISDVSELRGEAEEFEDEWEDVEEGEGALGWDPYGQSKRHSKKRRRHHKKPKYHSSSANNAGDGDDSERDPDAPGSNDSSVLSSGSDEDSDSGADESSAGSNEGSSGGSSGGGAETEEGGKYEKLTKVVPSSLSVD